jgi:antitoxin (DNA-binding transcriptional repressor) of toxin-antitoxin stability system
MKKLNIREARQSLSHLDGILAAEGEITITRRGKTIARVVPVSRKRSMPSHKDLRMEMPRLRKGSERLIREDRDAG